MSLINEALKKAQRERTGPGQPIGAPPAATPPPTGYAAAPRTEPRSGGKPWLAVFVVIGVIGGGAAVWFLKPGGPAPTAPVAVAPQTAQATPVQAQPAPAPAAPPEPAPAALQINLPGAAAPTAPAPTTPAAPPPAVLAIAAPAASATATTPPPAAVPTPAPESLKITLQMEDPRVLAFLDAARINGIRSVADDAKLLMNNKVFRAGAVVDRELGLKLVEILPAELVFEDARGIQYRKVL